MDYIFVSCQLINIYFTRKDFIKYQLIDVKTWCILLSLVFYYPLFEEALFRIVYKQYFSSRILNAILFSLCHSFNYLINPNIGDVLRQIITTFYLGYYLYQFDNFITCYIYHCYYNLSIIGVGIVFHFIFKPKFKLPTFDMSPIYKCPNRTLDDMNEISDYAYIGENKMEKDMIERHQKYDNLIARHKKKYPRIDYLL